MVDPKLMQKAKARIQSRSPNAFGIEPSNEDILNELSSIEQEEQDQNLTQENDNTEQLDSRMESAQNSRALFGDQISPELKEYAYNIFPSLNQIALKSKTQIPLAPEEENVEQKPTEENITREPASIEKPTIPTKMIKQSPEAQASVAQTQQVPTYQDDIGKLIEQSEEEEDRAALWKQSAKLRDAVMGAGLGRVKQTDVSMYEDLEKKAQRPLKNLLLKEELQDKKAKNDPNSTISKLMRDSLQNLGMNMTGFDAVSASQLEKLYPTLTQGLYNKIAAESRKEEAAANRQLRADAAESKQAARKEAAYEKTRTIVNNKIAKLQESKTSPFAGYNQAKQTSTMLNNALQAWDNSDEDAKIKNSVAFMQYAKIAQGDDSVVRSSDMQALAGGLNYSSPQALLNKFAAKTEGSSFTKGELLEMKKVVDTIRKIKKQQLQQRLDPIKLDAERGGYDLDQSISPDIIEEIYSPEPKPVTDRAKRFEELIKKQGK